MYEGGEKYTIFVGQPHWKRSHEWPSTRWLGSTKIDITKVLYMVWIEFSWFWI